MVESIAVTLETLYDLLRTEKKKEELQELSPSFFNDVVSYMREKKSLLSEQHDEDELFAHGERKKLEYEIRSIQRILKALYEIREKKIIDIALNKSRTQSDIIDTSAMLAEEKKFYDEVLGSLNTYRRGVLLQLFRGSMPLISGSVARQEPETAEVSAQHSDEPTQNVDAPEIEPDEEGMARIRFIHPMPSFVWKDMKEYGPYEAGEEISIYAEVAQLLVRKGRAEQL